jgi:hypothetical protein
MIEGASKHKNEAEEKDKKLFEKNYQHSYQVANFSPDSYQKAEHDETGYDNEQLEPLQNIFVIWSCYCCH